MGELDRLYGTTQKNNQGLVFGIRNNLGRSFRATCDDAGISGLSFHDLRHTATTRMVQAGLPAALVMKITGHTQMSTFQRYINPDRLAVNQVADALADYNDAQLRPEGSESRDKPGYIN
jgi:integrase